MQIAYALLALVVILLALPVYVFILSKWAQVGRMSGARWFVQKCDKERN